MTAPEPSTDSSRSGESTVPESVVSATAGARSRQRCPLNAIDSESMANRRVAPSVSNLPMAPKAAPSPLSNEPDHSSESLHPREPTRTFVATSGPEAMVSASIWRLSCGRLPPTQPKVAESELSRAPLNFSWLASAKPETTSESSDPASDRSSRPWPWSSVPAESGPEFEPRHEQRVEGMEAVEPRDQLHLALVREGPAERAPPAQHPASPVRADGVHRDDAVADRDPRLRRVEPEGVQAARPQRAG